MFLRGCKDREKIVRFYEMVKNQAILFLCAGDGGSSPPGPAREQQKILKNPKIQENPKKELQRYNAQRFAVQHEGWRIESAMRGKGQG